MRAMDRRDQSGERQPHEYSRRILLATIGLNPQILTETIYALAVEAEQPFVPNEIYVITTEQGKRPLEVSLLSPAGEMLSNLADDYGLYGLSSALTSDRIYVIRDETDKPLADISTEADNTYAADLITSTVRRLTSDDEAALHVSLAGGRKTMTFLMGYALSMFGREQDRLSHMLVGREYETHPNFFYPPRVPKMLTTRDGSKISTADADLRLAEIPFVSLRSGLPEELLNGEASYSETVRQAQSGIEEPKLIVDHASKRISCHGKVFTMQPLRFAIYAWLARRRKEGLGINGDGSVHWSEVGRLEVQELLSEYKKIKGLQPDAVSEQIKRLADGIPKETMEQNKARILSKLRKELGYLASHYEIKKRGRIEGSSYFRIGLEIDAGSILFDALGDD